jgi:reductive dehalogenase
VLDAILIFLMGLALIGLTGITFSFLVSSFREKEDRATLFGGIQFVFFFGSLVLFTLSYANGFLETAPGRMLLIVLSAFTAAGTWLLFNRNGENAKALAGTAGLIVGEVERFDERETVFARDNLQIGTDAYKEMYGEHPEWEERDTRRRAMGGVVGEMGAIDKPKGNANFSAAIASMLMPEYLCAPHIIRPMNFRGDTIDINPEEATLRVKGFARKLGADLAGVARINPLWTYSHRGMDGSQQGEEWGQALEVSHEYVIVLATEMAFDLVQTSPHTSGTIETARNYAEGAGISIRLAQFIANLGYSATAEHLRHYQSLLVPMAVDAGLGEVGRHGYLITKELGPRLRLAGVTTDLPLVPDKPVDIGVDDFCARCEKCSDCCPSRSIPSGAPEAVNGTLRWKLNPETCHDYWAKVGTDCNICMRVCPFSHDRSLPHKVITEAVTRNKNARRLFLYMDDLFYGRKPKAKSAPGWASYAS